MVTWVPTVKDGFIEVEERVGIGIDLVEDIEGKFPYERRIVNTRLHFDGSIVDQ